LPTAPHGGSLIYLACPAARFYALRNRTKSALQPWAMGIPQMMQGQATGSRRSRLWLNSPRLSAVWNVC